tara:strand:- start:464 stop:673 length:210 start_codon:yes stop_codon:yes gene_type:complete
MSTKTKKEIITEELQELIVFIDNQAQSCKPIMDDYTAGEYNMLIRMRGKVEKIYEKFIKCEPITWQLNA